MTGFTRPTRIDQVNKYLTQEGYEDWELVRGNGYFYFNKEGGLPVGMGDTSVYVYRVGELTLAAWLYELEYILENNGN